MTSNVFRPFLTYLLGRGFLLNFFFGIIELRYWNFFRYSVILKIRYWTFSIFNSIERYYWYFRYSRNTENTKKYYNFWKNFQNFWKIFLKNGTLEFSFRKDFTPLCQATAPPSTLLRHNLIMKHEVQPHQ